MCSHFDIQSLVSVIIQQPAIFQSKMPKMFVNVIVSPKFRFVAFLFRLLQTEHLWFLDMFRS